MDPIELDFYVLTQIAIGTNRHGYGIADSINERLGTKLQLKRIYEILHALDSSGYAHRSVNQQVKAGPPKLDYTITAEGEKRLRSLAQIMRTKAQALQNTLIQLNAKFGPDYGTTTGASA